MSKSSWAAALLCAGLAVSTVIYTYRLDRVPAYLTLDEAHFAVHAESIARSGRNLNGQILPPLISLEDAEGEPFELAWGNTYYLPFGMYMIAAALQVLPFTEASVRAPSALLGGVINVALIFAVAWALFRSRLAAAASAALLALAPANVIISRQALDSVCQPAFILGGLWCIATYLRNPDPRLAFAAGAIFGSGIYVYITSILFMPFYLALFWLITWRAGVLNRRALLWSLSGFALVLLPMAIWLAVHPEAARSLQIQYNRADPGASTLMETLARGGVAAAIADSLRVYWSYFDPSFLFVQGGNDRKLSTGDIGAVLLAVAVLAPIGLHHLRHNRIARMLIVIGLLASPIPATIKGSPYAIQRASGLLIYLSLLAGAGLAALALSPRVRTRVVAALMVVLMAWQFAAFAVKYYGTYEAQSSRFYDRTAFRDVAALVLTEDAATPAGAVYLPTNFYDVGAKWRFYTIKHERRDLWLRTKYFDNHSSLAGAPADSIAVLPSIDAPAQPPEGWTMVGVAKNLVGEATATVIRRR